MPGMCGRFAFFERREQRLREQFGVETARLPKPSWNITPQQGIAVIKQDGLQRAADIHTFGLLPHWAKDQSIRPQPFNARAETIFKLPSFRAVNRQRCIIPCDGFYEWEPETKQPWYFYEADHQLLGFAGIWERWTSQETGEVILSAAIVTTSASEALQPIHHRMPIVLTPATTGRWLDDRFSADDMPEIIDGSHRARIARHRVGREVGRPQNNHAGLVLENSA